jgi:hypothetical protein
MLSSSMMEGSRRQSSPAAMAVACAIGTTSLLCAGLLASACGNDFDALFPTDPNAFNEAGPSTTSTSGSTGGTSGTSGNPNPNPENEAGSSSGNDGGSSGVDAGFDAGQKCGVTLPVCPPPTTQESGGNIQNVCMGCGCVCPQFPCNQGGRDNCTTTCTAGAICSSTCDVDNDCKLVAVNATSAKMLCTNNDSDSCELDCQGNSSCDLDCQHDRDCAARCQNTSNCVVRCGGQTNACNVDCMGGVKKDCPVSAGNKQVITCNRDCPL